MTYTRYRATWRDEANPASPAPGATAVDAGFCTKIEDTFVSQDSRITIVETGGSGVPTTRQIITSTGLSGGGNLTNDRTLIVVGDTTTQRVELANAGTLVGTRKRINLIQGANVTLTTADNTGSNQVDVTIAAATSGSSGIPASTVTAKGDLLIATGPGTVTRFPVGPDGTVPVANSANTKGVNWTASAGHQILQDLASLPQEGALTFTGGGVSVSDDATGASTGGIPTTLVTIPLAPAAPDATSGTKGIVRLGGDLGGTAASPTVLNQLRNIDIFTKGSAFFGNGTNTPSIVGVGAAQNMVVTSDNTQTAGVKWAFPPFLVRSINTVSASGATLTLSSAVNFPVQDVTLTANCTLTFPNPSIGAAFQIILRQDATGGRTVTWPAVAKFPAGSGTITLTANAVDALQFSCVTSGVWLCVSKTLDIR